MQIQRKDAEALFIDKAIGFKQCTKWDADLFKVRFSELPENVDEDTLSKLAPENRALAEQIIAALEKGETVTLASETETEETTEKPKKRKKGAAAPEATPAAERPKKSGAKKPAKNNGASKTEAPAKKKPSKKAAAATDSNGERETIPVDELGNREGTQAAMINSVLGKKAMTIAEVFEAVNKAHPKAKITKGRVRRQLRKLAKRKLAKKVDGKYSLV